MFKRGLQHADKKSNSDSKNIVGGDEQKVRTVILFKTNPPHAAGAMECVYYRLAGEEKLSFDTQMKLIKEHATLVTSAPVTLSNAVEYQRGLLKQSSAYAQTAQGSGKVQAETQEWEPYLNFASGSQSVAQVPLNGAFHKFGDLLNSYVDAESSRCPPVSVYK